MRDPTPEMVEASSTMLCSISLSSMRHCGPIDALAIAEQIRAAVVAVPPVVEGTPMPVRLSGGVAGYPEHAIGMRELLLAAERALRQAKETGRDRVAVSS